MLRLKTDIEGLFRAYASILFSPNIWLGVLFVLATFWFPNIGLAGLLAAAAGMVTATILKFRNLESGLHVYNSLLVGLSLGASYQLDIHLAVLIIFAGVLAVFVTVAMADLAWKMNRLPALSVSFVLVALMTTLAAQSYGTLSRYLEPQALHDIVISSQVDQFFTALGSTFFTPHPIAGILMFVGLLLASRYLALLAVAGFVVGFNTYSFLSGSPHPDLVAWNGFNFILVTMAIGGVFTIPSKQTFLLALLAAAMTALVTASAETFMLIYGLPVMAVPFLLITLTMLLALTHRPSTPELQLNLDKPDLPEKSYERARLAKVRQGELNSVPLHAPFFGTWQVYQGFNGPHTHQAPWQHALDFYITQAGKSYQSHGTTLEDYYCFGLPVFAPVEGYVVKVLDSLPDNPPGQVDTENNWGNHVLIRLPSGLCVLLAHLQQHSIKVGLGAYVTVGAQIAKCGSSGRSPQPHLHLHVQYGEMLGANTYPFHLNTVLHQASKHQAMQNQTFNYLLFCRPLEGESIVAAKTDKMLKKSLFMKVGQKLVYHWSDGQQTSTHSLTVSLNLLGEMRLTSTSGANVAVIFNDNVLACYDRQGSQDLFLDAWLLAMGLTPLQEGELLWSDAADMALMPKTLLQKILTTVFKPMGGGLKSEYQRHWQGDAWQQSATHALSFITGQRIHATSQVVIQPDLGCVSFTLTTANHSYAAQLQTIEQQADSGIPAWSIQASRGKS